MKRFLAFFNRLRTRERAGAVFIVVLILYLVMDLTLIGPQERRKKALNADLMRLEGELSTIRADMTVVKAQLEKDPFAKDREQLDAYKRAIEQASAFLGSVESDPRQLGVVLRQILAATPGVTLVSLRTLPVQAVIDSKSGSAKQAVTRSIYRRGIEITIKGNYLAMLPYLEKIQKLPTKVLWSEADLDVVHYPEATLKLMIFTLTTQPESILG